MREQDPFPMGLVDGQIKVLTPEEYKKAVIQRNADEAVEDDADDDLSDLGEIEALGPEMEA